MGILYTIATPIGNLGDITYRAVETLRAVTLILCEDTRLTKRLLNHYQITTPTAAYHQFTKPAVVQRYMEQLQAGRSMALVSDAGTPGLSDPGGRLIQAVLTAGIRVVPLPGPSAVITALQASGVDTSAFLYLGFLPHKHGRQKLLQEIIDNQRTVVIYESPHRLLKTLAALQFTNKYVVVARELTKIFEEFIRGSAAEVYEKLRSRSQIKGECVIIISSSQH